MVVVGADTCDAFAGISAGDIENRERSGLDGRTFALVKVAALVALDAPPPSYACQVRNALEEGVTPEDLLGVLHAVAPEVGGPRVMAAAPKVMAAMGLPLGHAAAPAPPS